MVSFLSSQDKDSPQTTAKKVAGGGWWRSPLALILLISFGIHLLALLIFGGKVLFQSGKNGMVFQSEKAAPERTPEADSPNFEESAHQEMADEDAPPQAWQAPQVAVPAEAVVKISGESGWAPPVRGEGRVPVAGLSGKGAGRGRGKSELFGAVVGNKKLGVVVDISGSMQDYLEAVLKEVLTNFPMAEVVLIEGCGMEEINAMSPDPGLPRRPTGRKKRPRREVGAPAVPTRVVELNSREGQNTPAVGSWGGLRQRYPRLYETLLGRAGTWVVVGDDAPVATRLAMERLASDHVQAIYWFSDFQDSVEPREGEKAAQIIVDHKIEMYLHPMDGLKNIRSWAEKVGAKVIEVRVEKSI